MRADTVPLRGRRGAASGRTGRTSSVTGTARRAGWSLPAQTTPTNAHGRLATSPPQNLSRRHIPCLPPFQNNEFATLRVNSALLSERTRGSSVASGRTGLERRNGAARIHRAPEFLARSVARGKRAATWDVIAFECGPWPARESSHPLGPTPRGARPIDGVASSPRHSADDGRQSFRFPSL